MECKEVWSVSSLCNTIAVIFWREYLGFLHVDNKQVEAKNIWECGKVKEIEYFCEDSNVVRGW